MPRRVKMQTVGEAAMIRTALGKERKEEKIKKRKVEKLTRAEEAK